MFRLGVRVRFSDRVRARVGVRVSDRVRVRFSDGARASTVMLLSGK